MITITYLAPHLGGVVDAYLTVISVMDMPLFVIAVPYGLLWERATWQGAIAGHLAGSAPGAVSRFGFGIGPITLLSGCVAGEIGFVPLSKTGAELLFEIFSQRYERASVLVTSNQPALGQQIEYLHLFRNPFRSNAGRYR